MRLIFKVFSPVVLVLCSSTFALADSYTIDAMHSSLLFKANHLNISNFYGVFKDFSGSFVFDKSNPEKNSITVTIKAASVDSRDSKRDKHLRSPDFLSAKQFPEISFTSKKITPLGDKKYRVEGDIMFLGKKRPISAKAVLTGQGPGMKGEYRMGFETSFSFNRSEHGMSYMLDKIGDKIEMLISFEGVRS